MGQKEESKALDQQDTKKDILERVKEVLGK